MIVAVGIDIVEIARFQKTLDKHQDFFLRHIYTPEEQAAAPANEQAKAEYFAARWAVKEAVAKVLGTGIGKDCAWKDIQVQKTPTGQPMVTLTGQAEKTAEKLEIDKIHVSISHEKSHACAMAVGEKINN